MGGGDTFAVEPFAAFARFVDGFIGARRTRAPMTVNTAAKVHCNTESGTESATVDPTAAPDTAPSTSGGTNGGVTSPIRA